MGTYFYAVVDLDDGPQQMEPQTHHELTLPGHTSADDPRLRGIIAHIRHTPRRVRWMSDERPEYQALVDHWFESGKLRAFHPTECTIPGDAPESALEYPIVADIDVREYIDAREWSDWHPLPVLAAAHLAGWMARDQCCRELARRWYGHRLRAYAPDGELAVDAFQRITP